MSKDNEQPEGNEKPKPIKVTINKQDLEKLKLQQEDVDFVADSRAALLSKSTPLAKGLLYFLGIFIITGLIWSSISKVDEVTRGMGQVIPASKVQVIQNLEGGIVKKIYVKEGQLVEKDQVLFQLDTTQFSSQYQEGKARYIVLLATIARLEAELGNKSTINFPAAAQQNPALMTRETALFNSRRTYLKNTLANLQSSYNLAQHEVSIIKPLAKKGVVSKVELLRIQRELTSIKTRIDATRDNFKQETLTELTKNKAESEMLQEKLTALKDRMTRTTVKSPVNGIVKQIYINTVGGVVKPGMPIMDVVPLNDNLIIEAQIKPENIAFIKIGQKATIRVTAYDYAIYGSLPAVVSHISADTSKDQYGNSYYEVNLKVDKNYLGSKPGLFPLKPGMMTMVDIITGKRSVLKYLLKPLLRAKERALRER